ncbi:unnamed protein product [Meganyctiphanes norvegica]|uniref:Ig-like domain-containing protein n=1 Tax=Meganyctiphanes norvegica TaxID=48144 RepID=A0AAV2R1Z1_MEGNR
MSWTRTWTHVHLLSIFIGILSVTYGWEITDLKVPYPAIVGETGFLYCNFDLESRQVHRVQWYKDTKKIFAYIPNLRSHRHEVWNMEGVDIDVSRSSLKTLVLLDLTVYSGGEFRCEVIAAADYLTKSKTKLMDVYALPEGRLELKVERDEYAEGELLVANCTAPEATPQPRLTWSINGEKALAEHNGIQAPEWPSVSTLLQMELHKKHFQRGIMKLSCHATIPDIYDLVADRTISLKYVEKVAKMKRVVNREIDVQGKDKAVVWAIGVIFMIGVIVMVWFNFK